MTLGWENDLISRQLGRPDHLLKVCRYSLLLWSRLWMEMGDGAKDGCHGYSPD